MLYEGISRQQLADLASQALIAANTLAGENVFEPRDWPTALDDFPMIIVSTPREQKQSLGRGVPQFNSIITLAVVGRVLADNDEEASTAMRTLSDQVENAVIASPDILAAVQQFVTVEVTSAVSAEGKFHIGEFGILFGCEVFQIYGPDISTPLTDVRATITGMSTGGTLAVADQPL